MEQMQEFFTFECKILRHSEKAIQIEFDGEQMWIPKSQIDEPEELPPAGNAEISITAWIAKQKGLR